MPERVVDLLELVEIDKEHGQTRLVPPGPGHRLLQALQEGHAVGQTGEGIVVGEVAQALGHLPALGDVAEVTDQAGHGRIVQQVGDAHLDPAEPTQAAGGPHLVDMHDSRLERGPGLLGLGRLPV